MAGNEKDYFLVLERQNYLDIILKYRWLHFLGWLCFGISVMNVYFMCNDLVIYFKLG